MSEPLAAARRDQIASAGIVLAGALYGALLANGYELRLLALAGCYAIAVIGYQRLFGDLGLLSLAQGAFFAIGAYAVALFNGTSGELALAIPIAVVAATMVTLICTVPLLRLGSHYLALASLAIAMLVLLGAVNLVTGGANGIALSRPPRLFGVALDGTAGLAILIWALAVLAALAYWRGAGLPALRRQLLRDKPRAAAAIGLNGMAWQRGGFVFAAALAALGGALYAPVSGVVSPQTAELGLMVNLLAASVIGGRGKVAGALLGALLLVLLPEVLRFAGNWYLFVWGAALLAILVLAPSGLAGALEALLRPSIKPRWIIDRAAPHLPSPAPADLRAEDLRKSFGGVVAVDGVSLALRGGEMVALIGPNGAGKSTLLNLICGTEHVDSGRLLWAQNDITTAPVYIRARLGIARCFQTSELPTEQSALDAVASGAADGIALPQARGQALALFEQLGIAQQAQTPTQRLAPATRRLVEIARAMMARPALLALDEPTAGMNEAERAHLALQLQRWRSEGLTLLIVEHDIAFAALADCLCCVEAGRIVAQGSPAVLRADPALARFFGAT